MKQCIFFIGYLLVFLVSGGNAIFAETKGLNLRLETFQALREGIKGTEFKNEYVRVGLPFPEGLVKDLKGRAALSIEGALFQTRTLKRWPDGSVKWALVEFFASVSKGGKAETVVKEGSGISSEEVLASERNNIVLVDTGPLQVEIRKKGFNIFNRVTVDGQEVVRDGNAKGIVLSDAEGNEYLASQCSDTKVIIEENGPVKAVIRVDGSHSKGKNNLLNYTMRLFFYKGKSRVNVQYTLRNASMKSIKHGFIKSLHLDMKLDLGDKKKVIVSTSKGHEELKLENGSVNFYQAVSDFPWLSDGDSFYYHGPIPHDGAREDARGYKQEGFRVWQDGKLFLEGKRSEYADLGYIDVSDMTGRGMTAGIKYMAGNWPKSLKADASGKVTVSLWPEENGQGYWIRYGSHTTFDVMYDFHTDTSFRPEEEMARFQYPLVARAPLDWYNRNVEGIYPLYHFISFSDEKKLAQKLGGTYEIGWRKPKFKVWRYHYWGHGAFLNQHDFARISLVNSLREDRDLIRAGEHYLTAEAMFNYYADWAVYHSDDYDYAKNQFKATENSDKADLAKVVFEWEHQHWYGMPLFYYMTGDERIREAVLDWGEYVKKLANPLHLTYMRVFGGGMFSLAAMYEFTGDDEFLRLADMNFDRLLKAKYNGQGAPPTIFIDWERGVVAGGSGSGWPGIKVDVMMGSILYDGLLNYYMFTKDSNPMKSEARRLLIKISEFMLREPYFEGMKRGHWAYWLPYVYNLSDREKSDHSYRLVGQASFWTVFPYMLTGEKKWLEQMSKMMKMALWDEAGVWGSFGYLDHPGYQTIGYYLLKAIRDDK